MLGRIITSHPSPLSEKEQIFLKVFNGRTKPNARERRDFYTAFDVLSESPFIFCLVCFYVRSQRLVLTASMTIESVRRHCISLCIKDLPEFVEKVENTGSVEERTILAGIAKGRLFKVQAEIDEYLKDHGDEPFAQGLEDINKCVNECIDKMNSFLN